MSAAVAALTAREVQAWEILGDVVDPEIPVVSIVDLGIVRFAREVDGVLEVGLTPTYSGCPATRVIEASVRSALVAARVEPFRISTGLSPAWSTDWVTPAGRAKLNAYGIAPPVKEAQPIACPRCNSRDTERISEFGSTPCKALHRCRACLEPFDFFKCL